MRNAFFLKDKGQGAWLAQLVKCPTLDFGSGHDLKVVRLIPMSGSILGVLPLSLCPSPLSCAHALTNK